MDPREKAFQNYCPLRCGSNLTQRGRETMEILYKINNYLNKSVLQMRSTIQNRPDADIYWKLDHLKALIELIDDRDFMNEKLCSLEEKYAFFCGWNAAQKPAAQKRLR